MSCRAIVSACIVLIAPAASAHGFGQRFDLPLPLSFWVVGAGVSILLSFAVVIDFVPERALRPDYARLGLIRWNAFRFVWGPLLAGAARVLAVLVLFVTIASGLFGSQEPGENLAPTMVWIVWWVGVAFVSALVIDVWRIANPWSALFSWAEAVIGRFTGRRSLSPVFEYPAWSGVWFAVAVMWVFAWCEHVWPSASEPRSLGVAALLYTILTLAGMALFGRDRWLQRCEGFSMAFALLGRFAPLRSAAQGEAGDARMVEARAASSPCPPCIFVRWPSAGLLDGRPVETSMVVFIILLLATVTFDGMIETQLWADLSLQAAGALGWSAPGDAVLVTSVALGAFPLLFLAVFWACSFAMAAIARAQSPTAATELGTWLVARHFVVTLVPIAVAYHLAHYLSLLVTSGQRIVPLISDPFGAGWDLLGTADYVVDPGLIGADVLWYAVVTSVILGHAFSVYLAHVVALDICGGKRKAAWMEAPMLFLMIGYTMVSLWILAQPAYA